ncbi:MAG: hypothetical protein IKB36_03670 [Clostridia bacterium]|nr:hypothetical protein [Clostridia bacterium]
MSNSAVITTPKNFICDGIGVFIRWNGGRDSVEGFLKYCELKGYPSPEQHEDGWKGLIKVLTNFFEGRDMCVDILSELCIDCLEHGVYIIENWQIVGRAFHASEQTGYKLIDMLILIDSCMPEKERITNLILELEASIEDSDSSKSSEFGVTEKFDEESDSTMPNEFEDVEEYYYENEKISDKVISFFKKPLLKVLQFHLITTLKIKNLL